MNSDLRKTHDRRRKQRQSVMRWLPRGVRPPRNKRRLIDLLAENGVLR